MTATPKKPTTRKSRRTKDQILQELEVTQRLLIEKEEELVLCQEELTHILQQQDQIAGAGGITEATRKAVLMLEKEVATLEEKLAKQSGRTNDAEKEVATLEEKLTKQSEKTNDAEKTVSKLRRELKATEVKQQKAAAQHSADEKRIAELAATVSQLEQQVNYVEPVPAEPVKQNVATPVLQPAETSSTSTAPAKATPQNRRAGARKSKKTIPRQTVPINIFPIADQVHQNCPFSASIQVDLDELQNPQAVKINCTTRLYARRLEDGWSDQISEQESPYDGEGSLVSQHDDIVLPAGLYRLHAVASFTSQRGTPLPVAAIHEGDLLQVV